MTLQKSQNSHDQRSGFRLKGRRHKEMDVTKD